MKTTTKIHNEYDLYHDEEKDVFVASVKGLRKILGEPVYEDERDKISQRYFKWVMETDNGDIFVVWPEHPYQKEIDEDEIQYWGISAPDRWFLSESEPFSTFSVSDAALNELEEALEKIDEEEEEEEESEWDEWK